ncbi:MAG: HigA family addiction module antidote protein [Planctomycetes bacterium]|nr:HigA family addiction module antidote protein [Planctomycetota bacterium]
MAKRNQTPHGFLDPIHPGEILIEEFLKPMGLSQYRLAKDLRISPMRVSEIVRGRRSISPATGLLLSRYFGMSESFFLGLQEEYDLRRAKQDAQVKKALARIRPIRHVG